MSHKHTKSQITDFPTSLPASDVYAWAKASTKPTYTYSEIGAAASDHNHNDTYYQKSEVNQLVNDNTTYHIWIVSSNGDVLLSSDYTTLTCQINKADNYVDTNGTEYSYSWRRYVHGVLDGSWCQHGKSVTINASNFTESIIYVCEVMQFYNIQDASGNQLVDADGNVLIGYYPCMTADITLFRSFDEKLKNYATTAQLSSLATGTGASGTWGINISGTAANATVADSANAVVWSNVNDAPDFIDEAYFTRYYGTKSITLGDQTISGTFAATSTMLTDLNKRLATVEDLLSNNTYYIQ